MVVAPEDRATREEAAKHLRPGPPPHEFARRIDCSEAPRPPGGEPEADEPAELDAAGRDRSRDAWYR